MRGSLACHRELRRWVRHRAQLVELRSCLKNQIAALLAGPGVASTGDRSVPVRHPS